MISLPKNWDLPDGSLVDVKEDDGRVTRTRTRSRPGKLAGDVWVVFLEDRTGSYLLDRCTPVFEENRHCRESQAVCGAENVDADGRPV